MSIHEGQVSVELVPLKTNLVNLPSDLVEQLFIQDFIVELFFTAPTPKFIYTGWSGYTSASGAKSIEMDPALANAYGLKEKTKIKVTAIWEYEEVTKIHVEPKSASDWEVTELHAVALEYKLLSQIRSVQLNAPIIVYPTGSITATLNVKKLEPELQNPKKFAKVSPNAEVIVAPRTRKVKKSKSVSSRSSSRTRKSNEISQIVLKRGISLPHEYFKDVKETNTYELYANFNEVIHTLGKAEYVKVSIIPGPGSNNNNKQQADQSQQVNLETGSTYVYAKLTHNGNIHNHVGLSRLLAIGLGVEDKVGDVVKIEPAHVNLETKWKFIIHPYTTVSQPQQSDQISLNDAKSKAEKEAKRQKNNELKIELSEGFLDRSRLTSPLTNGLKLPSMDHLPQGGILEFKNSKSDMFLCFPSTKYDIDIGDEYLIQESLVPSTIEKEEVHIEKAIGQDELLKKIEKSLKRSKIGALIFGASGSGKSLIINQISQKLHDNGVYRLEIDCSDFARESVTNLKEKIKNWLAKCAWYTPSVLVLEGLESIFPAEGENADNGQTRQLTEFFVQSVNSISKSKNLIILATARSKESINSYLFSSHCIEESFNLRAPNKEVRHSLIESFLEKDGLKLSKEFDISQLSAETEGYLPSDLKVLVDRINHEALSQAIEKGQSIPEKSISNDLFTKAITGYVPSNLRGVKLQKSTTSWIDIGGLTEAKSILLETLEWPTKYAPIFKSATLRLRSGILLYGYPGCGKTLLASAVAGQCGLNFISVKGPEILNKYIGASEQSVRELFERAQAAKPCILFFDEFDSIAPKRGHDSTGVTDRVVNQMLTQMDGAEGLDGVYVLAATSRPDLIDSALLRPGRLDKSVICDMPHKDDRLDILKSITRKMNLDEGVDLDEVADKTEGFSGADLQAVGYNAYLQAVHEKLEQDKLESEGEVKSSDQDVQEFVQLSLNQIKKKQDLKPLERTQLLRQIKPLLENIQSSKESQSANPKPTKKDSGVIIKHSDFITSLNDTKPSISVSEKLKLGSIYNQFVSGRDGNMPDGSSSNEIGARSTLIIQAATKRDEVPGSSKWVLEELHNLHENMFQDVEQFTYSVASEITWAHEALDEILNDEEK
ncbi:peroxin-1 [Wickerhamomyces ciferrii]|uniref:Peroxisomal ATPase PEX1 n=1 Tax=Wickerhamomyces ciferrii (strain ATCC 14091 / BCRC 22168 / CBS 111 / JCM 3599 / NBRC 0793 / NRRL Y-1031 F-60-10) TaxID=1206466 RepID=K0KQF4_WICCF|nr:peroxin-1 [Wickerhamomyces ciferrii]CCH43614.1 peroxin-1 [Wickerhamomyces ciferrii]